MSGGPLTVSNPLIIVLGATASGKTKLAVSLALALKAEIISADSRQVFKGMDIGTGKDLSEYSAGGKDVHYHLIDIKNAGERYHVNEFKDDFYAVFTALNAKRVMPILCGGTGMYINSILQNHTYTSIPVNETLRTSLSGMELPELRKLLSGYPPGSTSHADQSTRKRLIRAIEVGEYLSEHDVPAVERPAINPFAIGLLDDVERRRQKIADRLESRLKAGMVDEVAGLLKGGVPAEMLTFYGLEYKLIVAYLEHRLTFEQMKEQLFNGICQYAKRQMTFFRKMEKDGVNIRWYQADMDPEIREQFILKELAGRFALRHKW